MIFCTHVCSLSRLEVASKMILLLSALPGVTSRLKSVEFGTSKPSGVITSLNAVMEREMGGSIPLLDVEGRGRSSPDISPDIVREQSRKLS